MTEEFSGRFGFMNSTRRVADGVEKRFTGRSAHERWEREMRALRRFEGSDVTPTLVRGDEAGAIIVSQFIGGVNVAEVVEQAVNADIDDLFTKSGAVLDGLMELGATHGDFGPQNLISTPAGIRLVDWEWYGVFTQSDFDAYWFDFVVRYHYPRARDHLKHFWRSCGHERHGLRGRSVLVPAFRLRREASRPGSRAARSWIQKEEWLLSDEYEM